MDSRDQKFDALLLNLDRRFAETAIANGYMRPDDLTDVKHKDLLASGSGQVIRTLPQVLLEKGLMNYDQIESTLQDMLDGDHTVTD